jgi:hypothetical protein
METFQEQQATTIILPFIVIVVHGDDFEATIGEL